MSSRKTVKIISRKIMMIVMIILMIIFVIKIFKQSNANRPKALPKKYNINRVASKILLFRGTVTDVKYYKKYTVLIQDDIYTTLKIQFENIPLNKPIEIWSYSIWYHGDWKWRREYEVCLAGESTMNQGDSHTIP